MPDQNPYEVLQVHPRAQQEVITGAYRALMKAHFPNGIVDDTDRIAVLLNEAYDKLSDPKKRAAYDMDSRQLDGKIIGEYRILDKIAEGGFGITYRGEQILLNEPVCIKHCSEISPLHEQILIEEAKAVWDLRHYSVPAMRNILRLPDGSLALVMSYIPGFTLAEIIEKVGRLDAEDVCWIAQRVLNALKFLHFHGVVHGDIKPQNIIIQHESHMVVVVDYGLSIIKPSAGSKSKGYTEIYAPPEEIAGKPLLPESDFYSLGMTMLFALSGKPEMVQARSLPKEVPDPVRSFIAQLIQHDVRDRPTWEKVDLWEDIQQVRQQAFGRVHSDMKPIPGL